MDIKDYSNYKEGIFVYGGKAGPKKSVYDENNVWMLKFPQNTKSKETIAVSYTTSPVSEYIGSHIYQSMGFPVHETKLGTYQNKVVVACKDFKLPMKDKILQESPMEYLMNTVDDDILENLSRDQTSSQSYHNISMNDWLYVLDNSPIAQQNPEIKERFWDQFVVDAFIGNSDRHGGNWEFYIDTNQDIKLFPIYDNGNALFAKHPEEKIKEFLENDTKYNSIVAQGNTPFISPDYHKIDSFSSIKKLSIKGNSNKDLEAAIKRNYPKIDLEKINIIIDEIPEYANGLLIISNDRKTLYKKILADRAAIIEKSYNLILNKENKLNNSIKISLSKPKEKGGLER